MCMVSDPEYDMTTGGSQDFRGKIYSLEYRNGNNFGTQSNLHGHVSYMGTIFLFLGRGVVRREEG